MKQVVQIYFYKLYYIILIILLSYTLIYTINTLLSETGIKLNLPN